MSRRLVLATSFALFASMVATMAFAQPSLPQAVQEIARTGWTQPLKIMGLLTVLALLPAIVLTMTSFTRIVIVLSFVRTGIGTAQVPPTQVLVGLALVLTLFTMAPVVDRVAEEAYRPYAAGQIDEAQALERAAIPLRSFLLRQTREADLALFYEAARLPLPRTEQEVPMRIAVPAFVVSELTTAFQMGVLVLLPFLLIDLAVSSTLMAMGMMMVPPSTISMPLKLLLFIVVDGWHLLLASLLRSFS